MLNGCVWPLRSSRYVWWRLISLLTLVAVVSACQTLPRVPDSSVSVPTLNATTVECTDQREGRTPEPTECTLLYKDEFDEFYRQFQSACLELGQSAEECKTDAL